jgi:glycerol-3-phosphate acyltransferase PlsY
VPAIGLSWLGGWMSLFWTVLLLGVTWLAMGFVGAAGICCSAHCKSSWRSLLFTVAIAYGGGFFLYGIAWPVALIGFVVILLTLVLIDFINKNQTTLAQSFMATADFYMVASCLALVAGFLAMIKFFISDTQKHISDRERIRHWKEEEAVPRPRRRRRRQTGVSAPQAANAPKQPASPVLGSEQVSSPTQDETPDANSA